MENLVLSLGKEIKWKEAQKLLGHWEKRKPEIVLNLIAQGKINQLIEIGEELASEGASFSDYFKKLLGLVQQLILIRAGVKKESPYRDLAKKFELKELVNLSDIFSEAVYRQKNTVLPQLPFQLAVIKYLGNKQKAEGRMVNDGDKKARKSKGKRPKVQSKKAEVNLKEVKKKWNDLLQAVKPMNHSVAAFLRAAHPKKIDGNYLILEVSYQFHKDKLEEHRNRQIVEKGLEKVFNSYVKIKCTLGNNDNDLYNAAKNIFG